MPPSNYAQIAAAGVAVVATAVGYSAYAGGKYILEKAKLLRSPKD